VEEHHPLHERAGHPQLIAACTYEKRKSLLGNTKKNVTGEKENKIKNDFNFD
jgi:hypothetical protein